MQKPRGFFIKRCGAAVDGRLSRHFPVDAGRRRPGDRMRLCGGRPGPEWVKMRKSQAEQMYSALPSNSDIARCSRHFEFVPWHEIAAR